MNAIDQLVTTRRRTGDRVDYDLRPDWLQGRTTFGGVAALMGAQAMQDVLGPQRLAAAPLMGLQTSFVGPIGEGEVQLEVEVLRQGRNITQVQATARQANQVCGVYLGTFAAPRSSPLTPRSPVQPPCDKPAPTWPPADSAHPARPGLPEFLRHFDMKWALGGLPFSGSPGHRHQIYLRLRGEAALTLAPELQAVLLGDLPATPAVSQLTQRAPSSSVTWALELCPPLAPPGHGFWRIDTESVCIRDGYVHHHAELWSPHGELAARGTQLVAVFA
jgi:acyl-CoA thioesterase